MNKYRITNPNNNIVRDYKSRRTDLIVMQINSLKGVMNIIQPLPVTFTIPELLSLWVKLKKEQHIRGQNNENKI